MKATAIVTDLDLVDTRIQQAWQFARTISKAAAGEIEAAKIRRKETTDTAFLVAMDHIVAGQYELRMYIQTVIRRLARLRKIVGSHVLNDDVQTSDAEFDRIRGELSECLEVELRNCSPLELSNLFHELIETVCVGLPAYLSLHEKLLASTPLDEAEARTLASLQPDAEAAFHLHA